MLIWIWPSRRWQIGRGTPSAGWIELPYCALPELDLPQIDITVRFLGHQLAAPMLITGMTGGTARADRLNAALVSVAARHNIAIGLGSQRASLEAGQSQHVLRKAHPEACLVGNLGGGQIIGKAGLALAERAVGDIEADALAIHLNPLQEAISPKEIMTGRAEEAYASGRQAGLSDYCQGSGRRAVSFCSTPPVCSGRCPYNVAARGGTN